MNAEYALIDIVETIIEDAGFEKDMYVLLDQREDVHVEFDDKASADYLLLISNDPIYKAVCSGYSLNGKRHRVTFFLW